MASSDNQGSQKDPILTSCDNKKESASNEEKRLTGLRHHRLTFEQAIDYTSAEQVYEVNDTDIILGKGWGIQNRPGNKRMREIVEKYKEVYHTLNRERKQMLLKKAYDEIRANGARFLKKVEGEERVWVIVDSPICIQKISHTFRSRIYSTRKQEERGVFDGVASFARSDMSVHARLLHTKAPIRGASPSHQTSNARFDTGLEARTLQEEMEARREVIYPQIAASSLQNRLFGGNTLIGLERTHLPRRLQATAENSELGILLSSNPVANLEAQRLATFHRLRAISYRVNGIDRVTHESMLQRQNRLIRETKIYQEMADATDAAILNTSMVLPSPVVPLDSAATPYALNPIGNRRALNPIIIEALLRRSSSLDHIFSEPSKVPDISRSFLHSPV
jgi:hypothetical protein